MAKMFNDALLQCPFVALFASCLDLHAVDDRAIEKPRDVRELSNCLHRQVEATVLSERDLHTSIDERALGTASNPVDAGGQDCDGNYVIAAVRIIHYSSSYS
jgi:hypothetical protein